METASKNSLKTWRILINIWSIVFFVAIIIDFLGGNSLDGLLNLISGLYIGVLAIYVSNKEFERWYDRHQGKHPGEKLVFVWTALMVILIVFNLIPSVHYKVPSAVSSAYIAVLTILVITTKSKTMYQSKREK